MSNRFDFLERLISHVEEKCSEFLSKYGLNNEWDIIKEMAERMATVMNAPETLQSMAMQAVDKSKKYSLDAIGNSWSKLLNKFSR